MDTFDPMTCELLVAYLEAAKISYAVRSTKVTGHGEQNNNFSVQSHRLNTPALSRRRVRKTNRILVPIKKSPDIQQRQRIRRNRSNLTILNNNDHDDDDNNNHGSNNNNNNGNNHNKIIQNDTLSRVGSNNLPNLRPIHLTPYVPANNREHFSSEQ